MLLDLMLSKLFVDLRMSWKIHFGNVQEKIKILNSELEKSQSLIVNGSNFENVKLIMKELEDWLEKDRSCGHRNLGKHGW